MPLNDSFSFELFKQLKEKFSMRDRIRPARPIVSPTNTKVVTLLAKAS
jgi:hypothetical protein